jgi:predicted metal-dependent TIM-barrel fold hydrolase
MGLVFDAHLQPQGLSDVDLDTLRLFGVAAALVPASPLTRPTAKAVRAHFDDLLQVQLPRLERAGIRAYAALGVHALSVPRRGLSELLQALPEYLDDARVVALGALSLTPLADPSDEALVEQLKLARRLQRPVLLEVPEAARAAVTRRLLLQVRGSSLPADRVLVHGVDGAGAKACLALGCAVALCLHPDQLRPERAVALVRGLGAKGVVLSSAAGLGASDLLALPRCVHLLQKAKLSRGVVSRIAHDNAAGFFRVASV